MQRVAILCLLSLGAAFAATCMDAGIGPCIPFEFAGFHSCPDGSACIVNTQNDSASICCSFGMLDTGNCNSTAVTASPPPCADKINPQTGVSDCPNLSYLCNEPAYYNIMTDNCPVTCHRCFNNITATTPACVDKVNPATGISDCSKNAALCTNPAYIPYMMDECPKTCGFC